MLVGEASNWEAVKAVLTAKYAMPRQEAWHRYVNCRLLAGETVDIYLGRLELLGGRLGLTLNDMAFRVKFYEGLPASIYEWAVTHEQAYPADVGSLLTRVRDYIVSRRVVEGRTHSAAIAADFGDQKGSSSASPFGSFEEHVLQLRTFEEHILQLSLIFDRFHQAK